MINGHPTRTVLSNNLGLRDEGAGEFGIPHLREDGRNSDVEIYKANTDGSRGKYLRTEPPKRFIVHRMFKARTGE